MHVLIGLDSSDYESLVTIVLAKRETSALDESYSLLLNHENKIEQKKGKIANDVMHNLTTNVAQRDLNLGKNNSGFQKNFEGASSSGYGGFNEGSNKGFNGTESGYFIGGGNFSKVIWQICFISGHCANRCKNILIHILFLKEIMAEGTLIMVLDHIKDNLEECGLLIVLAGDLEPILAIPFHQEVLFSKEIWCVLIIPL